MQKRDKKEALKVFAIVITEIILLVIALKFLVKVVYEPTYDGAIVKDPITGFCYHITDYSAEITEITNSMSIKDGHLNIPDSFWGRPVTTLTIKKPDWKIEKITSVAIPDSVIIINRMELFYMMEVTGGSNVTKIEACAFSHCENLIKVDLGDNIERIGSQAFAECTSLQEIKLGNQIEFIDAFTFYNCSNLSSVDLGYNISHINEGAFCGCQNLKEVTNTGNLYKIGTNAFTETGIEYLNVPNVIKIEKDAFKNSQLKSIEVNAQIELEEDAIPANVKVIRKGE